MTVNCIVCDEQIELGEKRTAESRGYGGVTIHTRCNHKSPVPHFQDAEDSDVVSVKTDSVEMRGVVEGKGPIKDPMEGYCLSVHAEQWDDLPTDQLLVIHRKKRHSWGEVWLWCDDIQAGDDGEIMSNWQNYGKVRDMELENSD